MQVPERLALIGGSILLSSTLVFTLKSQASSIIPNVSHSISGVFNHIGDAQKASDFDSNFQQAQKNGEITGNWGSSKYYIDNGMNMHIGKGTLQGSLGSTISTNTNNQLNTINFDQPVQFPQNSDWLLGGAQKVTAFNGLSNVDTSQVTNMHSMLSSNGSLKSLDLSSWDVSNVQNMQFLAMDDHALSNINVSGWKTNNLNNLSWAFSNDYSLTKVDLSSLHANLNSARNGMFNGDTSLRDINISGLDTSSLNWPDNVFGGLNGDSSATNNLQRLTLGDRTYIQGKESLPNAIWHSGNQSLSTQQLNDGNAHPGTWIRR